MRKAISGPSLSVRMSAAVFLSVMAIPLCFAQNWPPITPDDLKMTSIAEKPGAAAVILLRQETDSDKDNIYWVYRRIKILTEAGRKYADVELPYLPDESEIKEISGRTIHADGTIIPFTGKPFDKVILKAHGFKEHVKTFSLPDVQVGSILDISFTWRHRNSYSVWPPAWHIQQELFQKKINFRFIPANNNAVAWTSYLPRDHSLYENKNEIDLDMNDIAPLPVEPYMPPPNALRWRVNFYYSTSRLSPDEYWKNAGADWDRIVESFLAHNKRIEETVKQTIAANDAPEQKVRKLYDFVVGLENRSFIPERLEKEQHVLKIKGNYSVEDVLKQRSGTHDDLNMLFVALVRAAGLPARLILVADRSRTVFNPAFLNLNQFDALVAIVQLGGKDVFLDPGTRFCPYGIIDWRYSAVQGLQETTDNKTSFGSTSSPTYQQAVVERKAVLTLAEDDTEEGTVRVGFTGLEAMERRQLGAQTDVAGRKKLLEDEVKSWLPTGSEVTISKEPRWDETESPLIAEFKVSGPLAVNAGKRKIVPLHFFEVNEQPVFPAPDRTQAVYFDYPSQVIDQVDLTVPKGSVVESLPADDSVRLQYALYETKQKVEQPGTIVSIRNVIMGGMLFPKEQYKEIKDFYDKAGKDDGQQVLLKAAAHAEAN